MMLIFAINTISISAILSVSDGLLSLVFQLPKSNVWTYVGLLVFTTVVLIVGKYSYLERLVKGITGLLLVSVIITCVAVLYEGTYRGYS